jgi:hypothetical protein
MDILNMIRIIPCFENENAAGVREKMFSVSFTNVKK